MLNKTVFRLVLLLGAQIISFMNKHPFTESVQGIYGSLRIPRLTRTTDTRLAFFKTGCKECLEVLEKNCADTIISREVTTVPD